MRRKILSLALSWFALQAHAGESIVEVLERSQATRLEHMTPADPIGERARTVRQSFQNLVRALGIVQPVELRLVDGDVVAETLQGRIVVANVALASVTEGERVFVLAHELGHVDLRHWEQTERLYLKWIPGAVTPERTDPVAEAMGREASQLAHGQELQADGYALRAMHRLGLPSQEAVGAFTRRGLMQDTATHPGTRKRLASLRAAEAALTSGAADQAATTRNDPIVSLRRPD